MKKCIAFLLLLMAFPFVLSKEFKYSKVIGCGPQKPESFSFRERISDYKYFYIHKANNGDFVVWHDGYQFSSFANLKYSQLFVQSGGETSASLRLTEGIERYSLQIKNSDSLWIRIFMFDPSSMTYVSRVEGFQPSMGVCWVEKLN